MHTAKLELPTISLASPERRTTDSAVVIAFAVPVLVALASLGGLLIPSLYARESANWAAQAIGQDWVDLLFAVPWLVASAWAARRGSKRALLLLAGGLVYTFYEFVIYGFGLHFNAFFLVYCAVLGASFFALAGIGVRLVRDDVSRWYEEPAPLRTAAWFLIAVGVFFCLAWMGEILPAIVLGTTPGSIVEAGTPTNPVFVIDLSVVLPLHLVAGVALLRRRPLGYALAPIVLGFGALMALSIAGMMLVMRQRGLGASVTVAGGMALISLASSVVLGLLLRRIDAHR